MADESLLNNTLKYWTELNLNRSTTSDKRRQEKIAMVHQIVCNLAETAGLDKEYIEDAIKHHSKYTDPAPLLDSYRTYFPEFDELLQALRISDQIDSRLRLS
jgi:hypothetical protein